MLSQEMIEYLDRLYQDQHTYLPSKTIAAQLASKQILLFVGPTCIGKNTIMEAVAASDNRFSVAGTFTSREPRPDDKDYTYYENSDGGLRALLTDIAERRVVQYAVNPHAHTLYGSRIEDYPGECNMADVFSSAVSQFLHLGFRQAIVLSLVAEPTAWLSRFEQRFPVGHPQRKARRDEAIESITWSLRRPPGSHCWLVNTYGQQQATAQKVITRAEHGPEAVGDGYTLAHAMLQAAQGIA
jgi:hypothetical protein